MLLSKPIKKPSFNFSDAPASLMKIGSILEFRAGDIIFNQYDPAEKFYFIISGEIALSKRNKDGDQIEISRISSNAWFGEVMIFAEVSYLATSRAVKDSRLLCFEKTSIKKLILADAIVASFFIHIMAQKCVTLTNRIEQLTIMPVRERLLRFLSIYCPGSRGECAKDGNCTFALPGKKREIAAELGVTPETLSRTFKELEIDGLIKVNKKNIEVKNCLSVWNEIKNE